MKVNLRQLDKGEEARILKYEYKDGYCWRVYVPQISITQSVKEFKTEAACLRNLKFYLKTRQEARRIRKKINSIAFNPLS